MRKNHSNPVAEECKTDEVSSNQYVLVEIQDVSNGLNSCTTNQHLNALHKQEIMHMLVEPARIKIELHDAKKHKNSSNRGVSQKTTKLRIGSFSEPEVLIGNSVKIAFTFKETDMCSHSVLIKTENKYEPVCVFHKKIVVFACVIETAPMPIIETVASVYFKTDPGAEPIQPLEDLQSSDVSGDDEKKLVCCDNKTSATRVGVMLSQTPDDDKPTCPVVPVQPDLANAKLLGLRKFKFKKITKTALNRRKSRSVGSVLVNLAKRRSSYGGKKSASENVCLASESVNLLLPKCSRSSFCHDASADSEGATVSNCLDGNGKQTASQMSDAAPESMDENFMISEKENIAEYDNDSRDTHLDTPSVSRCNSSHSRRTRAKALRSKRLCTKERPTSSGSLTDVTFLNAPNRTMLTDGIITSTTSCATDLNVSPKAALHSKYFGNEKDRPSVSASIHVAAQISVEEKNGSSNHDVERVLTDSKAYKRNDVGLGNQEFASCVEPAVNTATTNVAKSLSDSVNPLNADADSAKGNSEKTLISTRSHKRKLALSLQKNQASRSTGSISSAQIAIGNAICDSRSSNGESRVPIKNTVKEVPSFERMKDDFSQKDEVPLSAVEAMPFAVQDQCATDSNMKRSSFWKKVHREESTQRLSLSKTEVIDVDELFEEENVSQVLESPVVVEIEESEEYSQTLQEIELIRNVKDLTRLQLTYLVNFHEIYLRNIFQGKISRERHEAYRRGGKDRHVLTWMMPVGLFSYDQCEHLVSALVDMFCKRHEKYFDYVMRVLLPETMIKIIMDLRRLDHTDAELYMQKEWCSSNNL